MTGAARPARAEVEDRIALAVKLLRVQLGREPTMSEVMAQLSDADVDSLVNEDIEDNEEVGLARRPMQ